MAYQNLYITNTDQEVHLRDARHAHQLYNEHNFALAPKTKFLYHVQFILNGITISNSAPNTANNLKQIGVLAKSLDLPSYKTTVETKQQYNRKKNFQTRIDYDEVGIDFHDDNTGLTRSMLEEYYRYYFKDGNKNNRGYPTDFSPMDKYYPEVKSYGMDNNVTKPFFYCIKLFQLSRQKWFSYTLINPILTSWSHDKLDNSDGAGTMTNSISIAYEGVLYNNGGITDSGDPAGFTDSETGYDQVHSPLNTFESLNGISNISGNTTSAPKLINDTSTPFAQQNEISRFSNQDNPDSLLGQLFLESESTTAGQNQYRFPIIDTQDTPVVSTLNETSVNNIDRDEIQRVLANNQSVLDSTVRRALATGAYSSEWGVNNFSDFENLSPSARDAIEQDVINRAAGGDVRLQQIASQVISTANAATVIGGRGSTNEGLSDRSAYISTQDTALSNYAQAETIIRSLKEQQAANPSDIEITRALTVMLNKQSGIIRSNPSLLSNFREISNTTSEPINNVPVQIPPSNEEKRTALNTFSLYQQRLNSALARRAADPLNSSINRDVTVLANAQSKLLRQYPSLRGEFNEIVNTGAVPALPVPPTSGSSEQFTQTNNNTTAYSTAFPDLDSGVTRSLDESFNNALDALTTLQNLGK